LQGIFDEMDLEKLGDLCSGHFNQRRLSTVEVVGICLYTTAENRTPRDVQLLINQDSKRGSSEATQKYYQRGMRKVFNWLSEDMEFVEKKNPLKKVKVQKKNGSGPGPDFHQSRNGIPPCGSG